MINFRALLEDGRRTKRGTEGGREGGEGGAGRGREKSEKKNRKEGKKGRKQEKAFSALRIFFHEENEREKLHTSTVGGRCSEDCLSICGLS